MSAHFDAKALDTGLKGQGLDCVIHSREEMMSVGAQLSSSKEKQLILTFTSLGMNFQ